MAALDGLRRRVSLSSGELEQLRLISNGELDEVPESLRSWGLVGESGEVLPLVLDLAQTMTSPLLELWVESAGPQGQTLAHVVVGGDEAVWYTDPWPDDGNDPGADPELVHTRDELPQLLWILARLVGFRRSVPPDNAAPITASLNAVSALMTAFAAAGGDTEDVRTVAIATLDETLGELADSQRELWLAVLATLQHTWRITCSWGPEPRRDARGLAVWDCGPAGYFARTSPVEPLLPEDITPETEATFTPLSGGDLWKALAELLPSKDELLAVAADRDAG